MTESEILASLVRRIEAVREEKKLLTGSERDLFSEAKGKNIDGKALRRVLQRRAMDDADREAFDDLVDQYEQALAGKAVARDAIKGGATVREAAKRAGISVGAAQAQRSKIEIPDHDPTTGEITTSPAGGENSSDASPPQAASQSSREVPAGEPIETDRPGNDDGAPEGAAEGVKPPTPDPYRPSNGTEGEIFMGKWCGRCTKDAARRTDPEADGCSIPVYAMACKIGDPDYPKEWVRDEAGRGQCTAFEAETPPTPDPDEGWEKADSAGNYGTAYRAIRERHVASGQARLDAGDIPAFLDRRARHA